MLTLNSFDKLLASVDCCPWDTVAGRGTGGVDDQPAPPVSRRGLYTAEERRRRDSSPWTMVQGVLAPTQFAVFLISLFLVLRYLATGVGLTETVASILVKTLLLYTIMVTGSIWERDVFGRYLFAPAFFWEDVVSILVLALHTAYVAALITGALTVQEQMYLALAAYASYVVNAAQFLRKLRLARLEQVSKPGDLPNVLGISR